MRSKFTIKGYLVLLISFTFTVFILYTIPVFFEDSYYNDKIFPRLFIPTLLIFTFIYLIFGEIRKKIIILGITKDEFIVKRFLGLKTEIYKISDIQGWKYSHLSSKSGTYEYLYIYKNDKKVIKISEFYHKNYSILKSQILSKTKHLGYEKFSIIDEFKDIFT